MSDIVLLRPEMLALALLLLPILFVASRRLKGLAPWRRQSALLLQSLSAILLVVAIAEPAIPRPDDRFALVVLLDSSKSLSEQARAEAAEYAKGVLAGANPADSVRFVAAGSQATLLSVEEVSSGSWISAETALKSATDLAGGLRLAGSLLADAGKRRIVLLSDGWETRGHVADEAARVKARGIDLQVVPLTALGDPEVIVRSLSSPPYVRVGDSVSSELHIYSTRAVTATLSLSVDGSPPSARQIDLAEGDNLIPLEQRADLPGFHRIEASITAGSDTSPENNAAASTLVVKPQPRVLVLEERSGESRELAAALAGRQVTVDVQGPSFVPAQLEQLDRYDSIIMYDVAATSLTLDQQRTLQEYVRRLGKGLVVVGGDTSYGKGGYVDSVFEEMLPVSSQPAPRPQKGKTALMLVFDRSASMDEYRGQNSGPSKFSMAKEAARLAVDAVRADDTLGVLSFDTEFIWTVPVQRITGEADKESIKETISNIELGGGTDIYPALEEGANAIRTADAPAKHIVLLTDGRDYHTQIDGYTFLLDRLRREGITVSVIGIGRDTDRQLLTEVARLGQGRFYFTEQLENIPKIVFKELDLALKEAVVLGAVQPHLLSPSPLLRGLAPQDVPQLQGFDITTAKDEAVVGLVADQGFPLLAHWQYGLGRVVSFTSDAGRQWAGPWVNWDEFGRFWSQTVRWSMPAPVNRLLQPSVSVAEQEVGAAGVATARLTVESLNADNSFADLASITAGLRDPNGVVTTTLLSQVAPGRYEAEVSLSQPGAYEVRLRREGDAPVTETAGFSVSPGAELLNAGTHDRLLKQLNGGNEYLSNPEEALDSAGLQGASAEAQPLWGYMLAPALVLLLLSAAVRRLDFRLRRRPVSPVT